MIKDTKGQAVAFDIMLIFLCITFFTAGIWAFTLNMKAPSSQAQRSKQDFTKSLLITALYTTPSQYGTKSLSDILAMHLTNPEKVPRDVVIKNLKAAKIDEYLKERGVGTDTEWFLYTEYGDNGFMSATPYRSFCFHGIGGDIQECGEKVGVKDSTTAMGDIVSISPGSSTNLVLLRAKAYLTIKWA